MSAHLVEALKRILALGIPYDDDDYYDGWTYEIRTIAEKALYQEYLEKHKLPSGYILHGSCKSLDYLKDPDSWFMICGEAKEQSIEKIEITSGGRIKAPNKRVRKILEELSK